MSVLHSSRLSFRSSLFLIIALLLLLAIIQAPSFLFFSETPVKADAVILFLGDGLGTREKEADQLLKERFADYLIFPAFGQIKKRGPDGRLEDFKGENPEVVSNQRTKELTNRKWFVENTHIEVLEGKRLMDNHGLRSALLVSSPHHMRRIKFIAGKVFDKTWTVRCVPTRYEIVGEGFWLFNNGEYKLVFSEYAKIVWFFFYSNFLI
jgi:hypothetical protein